MRRRIFKGLYKRISVVIHNKIRIIIYTRWVKNFTKKYYTILTQGMIINFESNIRKETEKICFCV